MSGSSGEPTEDGANSLDEAMARLFVELGPLTILSPDDESEG